MRLVDGGQVDNWTTGRLQFFLDGSWRSANIGELDLADAEAACRKLGLGAGTLFPQAATPQRRGEFGQRVFQFPGRNTEEDLFIACVNDVLEATDVGVN